MIENGLDPIILFRSLHFNCRRCKISYFKWTNLCSSIAFISIFFEGVDIMLLVNGVCTLVNVIIVDFTQAYYIHYLLHFAMWPWWLQLKQKNRFDCDQHLTNVFLFFAIEVFDCLQMYDFFHWYVNITCLEKGTGGHLEKFKYASCD